MKVWGFAVYLGYIASAASYIRVTDPSIECDYITNEAECEDAVNSLGYEDILPRPDAGGKTWAPPYCFMQGMWLMFNENGSNTGQCKLMTPCICRDSESLPAPGLNRRRATPAPTIILNTPRPTTNTPAPTLILTPSPTLLIEPSQQRNSYWLVGIPIECERITSKNDCTLAGRHLIGDQTVVPVDVQSTQAPPNCYVENGVLKWNTDGSGACSANTRCVCRRGMVYREVTEGRDCRWIRSITECNSAAEMIGFSDITAIDDGNDREDSDPKGCYWEGGQLKYNSAGTNTGDCSVHDRCLCRIRPHEVNDEATEFVDTALQGLPSVKRAEIRSISGSNAADHYDLVLEVELSSE